jgi:hypothetical protein
MKKITLLALALSFGLAAPVFACPSMDAENAKTAKKTEQSEKTEKKDTAQKEADGKTKPATTAKKAGDKVSMR